VRRVSWGVTKIQPAPTSDDRRSQGQRDRRSWRDWRKYPLFFALLWWGLMSVVLFIEALQLSLIRGGELPADCALGSTTRWDQEPDNVVSGGV